MSNNYEKPSDESTTISLGEVKVIETRQVKSKTFPIVCIGGSAGSFQAMEKFFNHMPSDSGMAFIVIMHIDKDFSASAAMHIHKFTPMPVTEAGDGVQVEPNNVYVIPPNKDMGIHNRRLLLLPPAKPNGFRLPIDYFLQSLAEDQWNRAVAIILSGMGSDGETGIRMIKEKLGMAMVQDPETAQYNSMPRSAIGTNLVDYVLSPEEMPIKLIQYQNHPAMSDEIDEQAKLENRDDNAIHKILMQLRSHTGHDFSQYKKNTITRRIDRRLAFHQIQDYNHYINFLRENPHEVDVLFNELLIGVTKFFRDHAAFDVLKEKLFLLIRKKSESEPIRIWVAGCSTGEEAYSIAILVMECFAALKAQKVPRVQIFATDLDVQAIELARTGVYLDNIVADVSRERLEKYFSKREGHYQVKKELRELIVFAQHNLIKDAPFTRLDLLTCRNLMIYLNADLQKKIIPIFHYSLNPSGVLFLGPAETLGGFSDIFSAIDPKSKIFERKEGSISMMGKMIDFPFNVSKQPLSTLKIEETPKLVKKKTLAESFTKFLLDNYTPTTLLVNEKGDIMYINGRTGKFLELHSGEAIMNINMMAREELRYPLGNAIHQARAQKGIVTVTDIKLTEDENVRLVDLKVELLQASVLQGLYVIVLEDKGIAKPSEILKKTSDTKTDAAIDELEKELIYTKQQLNSTIEQMETSLEELKSTNEELQSTNEELQSTNEESLTTKEEMQSLNEELMTINVQYQAKAEELTQLNNDMKNMLDNTEIGTVFLDTNMTILRFTPQIKKLFNVIKTDIGRSIKDIVFNFDYPGLEQDINQVVETLVIKETEINTRNNEWYNLRIVPYRTMDNFINGVVLTFNNITKLKFIESKLEAMKEYARMVMETLRDPALLLDKDLNIITINTQFKNFFQIKEYELQGANLSVLAHTHWKTDKIDELLKQGIHQDREIAFTLDFPNIGTKHIAVKVKPSVDKQSNEILMVMLVIQDLTHLP